MSHSNAIPLSDRARGRWHGILTTLGIDKSFLTKKNGPCPMCGGIDRWRWTDHKSGGNWICNACGHGSGTDLIMKVFNLDFKAAAERIESVIGTVAAIPDGRRDMVKLRNAMRQVWSMGRPVTAECPVGLYLARRGIILDTYPKALRYVPSLRYGHEAHPAMLAQVVSPDGAMAVNIHRTWLTEDGQKAPVEPCRKMMEGDVPPGSAIRLFSPGPILGIAEGIETAFRASAKFGIPVWSLIAEGNLQKFRPPEEVTELWVFGDNDRHFVGQAASYIVARDIARQCERDKREMRVKVAIPDSAKDWADVA